MVLKRQNARFTELDSLRGVAALAVVFWHLMQTLLEVPAGSPYSFGAKLAELWQISPLYPLMAGREAVIIFFILSGFVLSLPWVRGQGAPYGPFLIKRICRIYLPYIVTVALALLAYAAFGGQTVPELSQWFNTPWQHSLSVSEVLEHLLLIGSFANEQYAVVIWSLVHEMRISLIFPLLMMPLMRWHWSVNLGVFLGVSLLGTAISATTARATDYPATLHYLIFFFVGALMAKHHGEIVAVWQRQSRGVRLCLVLVAFILYAYARGLGYLLGESVWNRDFEDLLVGVGATLLIVWLLSSASVQRVMTWRPFVFLGHISYSLYLLHPLVLLSLIHAFAGQVSVYILLALTLPLSILAAWLSYFWIEKPSMMLGSWLTTSKQRRRAAVASTLKAQYLRIPSRSER